jgi:hypothetical protein
MVLIVQLAKIQILNHNRFLLVVSGNILAQLQEKGKNRAVKLRFIGHSSCPTN